VRFAKQKIQKVYCSCKEVSRRSRIKSGTNSEPTSLVGDEEVLDFRR